MDEKLQTRSSHDIVLIHHFSQLDGEANRIGNLMRLTYGYICMERFLASTYRHLFGQVTLEFAAGIHKVSESARDAA